MMLIESSLTTTIASEQTDCLLLLLATSLNINYVTKLQDNIRVGLPLIWFVLFKRREKRESLVFMTMTNDKRKVKPMNKERNSQSLKRTFFFKVAFGSGKSCAYHKNSQEPLESILGLFYLIIREFG